MEGNPVKPFLPSPQPLGSSRQPTPAIRAIHLATLFVSPYEPVSARAKQSGALALAFPARMSVRVFNPGSFG